MAQPVFYNTINQLGFDPTVYTVASASVTPEAPAAPFVTGTKGIGSNGSEFVYVQASTSISFTDFVMINMGTPGGGSYQANSLTTTNVASSLGIGVASTGMILRQSVTFIPAGAFFWACTKGQYLPATTSGTLTGAGTVVLYTSATAGIISSVTNAASAALAGITVINSITVSIASSIVPPVGDIALRTTLASGFTQGPVVSLNNPRTYVIYSSTTGPASLAIYTF